MSEDKDQRVPYDLEREEQAEYVERSLRKGAIVSQEEIKDAILYRFERRSFGQGVSLAHLASANYVRYGDKTTARSLRDYAKKLFFGKKIAYDDPVRTADIPPEFDSRFNEAFSITADLAPASPEPEQSLEEQIENAFKEWDESKP